MPRHLYLHIPFCPKKCIYCDFLSVSYDKEFAMAYADALRKEIFLKRAEEPHIKTLYIGGGTPTVMSLESLAGIINALKCAFNFDENPEITVEANPGTLDGEKLKLLLSMGINRLSIGMQSFKETELKTLGRAHTVEEAKKAVILAREYGVENISIDLMYGIPGQNMESWKDTINKAARLNPSHISAYELTPEEGTPLYESITKGATIMPDEDTTADMFDYASQTLTSAGYLHYEISNYALSGRQSAHNLNYWERGEYIGIGAGAHSFSDGIRAANTRDIQRYISLLKDDVLPVETSETLSVEDEAREYIFLGLRKTGGFDIKGLPGKTEAKERIKSAARRLADDGMAEMDADNIRLTPKGLRLYNQAVLRLLETEQSDIR